ncbi:MAG TPA: hypothetical protein VEI45_13520 [Mycobacterium sp.]|nr:hypothetical protein [Mycobacterium sp.]
MADAVMQLSSVVRDCRSAANRPSGVLPADDYDAARGECPVELCGRDCASTNGARAPDARFDEVGGDQPTGAQRRRYAELKC